MYSNLLQLNTPQTIFVPLKIFYNKEVFAKVHIVFIVYKLRDTMAKGRLH